MVPTVEVAHGVPCEVSLLESRLYMRTRFVDVDTAKLWVLDPFLQEPELRSIVLLGR